MSSAASYFTKSLPKRADITGSPTQAFNMNSHKEYCKYILGGISAGTIAALGTIAPGSTNFQYHYAPQIHHGLVSILCGTVFYCTVWKTILGSV
jgi:hypothetical protein